jgi:hypothetical protein
MGTFEIFIQTSSAIERFAQGRHFEAGYFLGSGGLGVLWSLADIYYKYTALWARKYGSL